MSTGDDQAPSSPRAKRADAQRNEATLLAAAATVFASSGVNAPIRQIAAEAGVGVGTIYRHFPARADLVIAVYRHQVDACANVGPELLATSASPIEALRRWIEHFVDFLVTKHGLADVLHGGDESFAGLHDYFLDRLVPVCGDLIDAAAAAGELTTNIAPYELMRGIGNLCIGGDTDDRYEPQHLIELLLDGLSSSPQA
ncbi:MAG: TetR/AcrR family transcriptional regulator [Actinomycetota bacterium]